MAKGLELKGRIRSVTNTRKITRTMELVATSRLKRAQDRMVAARPYADALREVIADLYTAELAEEFPLLRQPALPSAGGPKRAAVLVITSNRGLAGAFNANLVKEARRRIAELEAQGLEVDVHAVGRKGIGFFKYFGRKLATDRMDIGDKPTPEHATELAAGLIAAYERGELASVDIVQARFLSALSTPPTTVAILPVPVPAKRTGKSRDYILSPGAGEILEQLLPLYVRNAVFRGLVETVAAEHSARRVAMKNATDNAGELLDDLKRTYNRERQAKITQEISEIVGGAAALNG